MGARGALTQARGIATHCLVPRDRVGLIEGLQRTLERSGVAVLVERRRRDRRAAEAEAEAERRAGERRARIVAVGPPREDGVVFVERLAPAPEHLEDLEVARLVRRAQRGDRAAFSEVYLRNFDRIYAYLRVTLRDPDHAEDLTQQVFLKAYQALPRYEHRGQPFRAWLFTIARNLAVSALRRAGRCEPVEPAVIEARADRGIATTGGDWLSDHDLMMFVDRLPLAQRQVLVLRYVADMPLNEIAGVLGRSDVDVRALHSRALRFLRTRMDAMAAAA